VEAKAAAPEACPGCGSPLRQGVAFCTVCGQAATGQAPPAAKPQAVKVQAAEQPARPAAPPPPPKPQARPAAGQPGRSKALVLGVAAGAVVLIVIGAAAVYMLTRTDKPEAPSIAKAVQEAVSRPEVSPAKESARPDNSAPSRPAAVDPAQASRAKAELEQTQQSYLALRRQGVEGVQVERSLTTYRQAYNRYFDLRKQAAR